MKQQLNQIATHKDLIEHLDVLYEKATERKNGQNNLKFQYLYKKIANKTTIKTAIKNIKSNKGSKTPGVDGKTIDYYLQMEEIKLIEMILKELENYKPQKIKRVVIPKPDGGERNLGIPTIIDRIIQETVKIVIEPICEAQFYEHSYGFRPHRSTEHAIAVLQDKMYMIKDTTWAIEGDISKFFDTIDHKIMLQQLRDFGIVDKKVLAIIREMLKAGIMNETNKSEIGTPQGGILSPLLANVYLDKFDKWIYKQWEGKKTNYEYSRKDVMINALRKTNLKPAYLVRYADDWIILTDTGENAIWWKERIEEFFQKELKIKLNMNKTLITNYRKKYISFLGFELKLKKSNSGSRGYVNTARPNQKRLAQKVDEIKGEIRKIAKESKPEYVVEQIGKVNSMIRGLVNYYEVVSQANPILKKYEQRLYKTKTRAILPHGGKMLPANTVDNLIGAHKMYETKIPIIEIEGKKVGITSLTFCNYRRPYNFPFKLTSYSPEGRAYYIKMKKKMPLSIRVDDICSLEYQEKITRGLVSPIYNFEYFLNRAYAFNRDKGKCKICKEDLTKESLETHHNNKKLSIDKINKIANLSSLCRYCHKVVHATSPDLKGYSKPQINKIMKLKEKLNV